MDTGAPPQAGRATGSLPGFLGGAIGSGALRAGNIVLSLGVAILLARGLGAEGYGIYAFAFSLITLLSIPAQAGLPVLLLREVARLHRREEWGRLRGLLNQAGWAIGLLSAVTCTIAALVAWHVYRPDQQGRLETLLWALCLIPLIGTLNIRGATLLGLRHVIVGQLPETLLRLTLLLAIAGCLFGFGALDPQTAMALHALAVLPALIVGAVLMRRAVPAEARAAPPEYAASSWAGSLLPLTLLAGMHVINAQVDLVMLGVMTTSEEVGIYRIASQGALLVGLPVLFVGATTASVFSRLYDAGDLEQLQQVATWTTRVTFALALAMAAVFLIFGESLLGMIFGAEYRSGYRVLAVLSIGHLLGAAWGSAAMLLNMTGNERETVRCAAVAVAVNVGLNLALIPLLGILGAALATASALLVYSAGLSARAIRRIGIRSSALAGMKAGSR